jgi:Rieske 2Fe-2S family protein
MAQIKKPGDYFLYHLQNEAIIVIRGNNGEVYGHYNTCRHRGSAICLQDKGSISKLICPYHQWVYDKDGTLLNARMMPMIFAKLIMVCILCMFRLWRDLDIYFV